MKHNGWIVQYNRYKDSYFKEDGVWSIVLFETTIRRLKRNALQAFYKMKNQPRWKTDDKGIVKAVKVYVEVSNA